MKAVTKNSIKTQNTLDEVSKPIIKKDEVLVKIHAAGVNHIDTLWVNNADTSFNPILGLEISGEIVQSNSNHFKIGQKVAALIDSGGYAEYASVPSERIIPIPEDMSYEVAASIPESYLTAFQSLFWIGNLKDNDAVLIHAGSGAVGGAAIQLAKSLRNIYVITTASSKNKEVCLKYGADHVIDYHESSFDDEVNAITNGQGVQLIIDFIGASYFHQNINSLSLDGKLVLIGNLGGTNVDNVNLMNIMSKRLKIEGTLLSTRSNKYKNQLVESFVNYTHDVIDDFISNIGSIFELKDADKALKLVRDGKNRGKVIIKI